jgi:hypothetical protein
MKANLLFFVIIGLLMFPACSKNTSITLAGKWVLTRSCVCNACSDTIPFYKNQTLVFGADGQVQLFGAVGNTMQYYSGTYSVTQQTYGKVLNINLNAPDSNKSFLYIPGSVIYSETETTLVLKLNTPFSNVCAYQNTYTAASK